MGTSIYYLLQTELAVKSKDCHLLLIYIYHMCAAAAAIRELLYLMFQNYSSLLFHLSTRSCLNSVPKPAAQDIIIIIIITIDCWCLCHCLSFAMVFQNSTPRFLVFGCRGSIYLW
jgi:hypothetical protein